MAADCMTATPGEKGGGDFYVVGKKGLDLLADRTGNRVT